jgi:hypothetical protein
MTKALTLGITLFAITQFSYSTTMRTTSYPDSNILFTEMLKKYVETTEHASTVNYKLWKKQSRLKLKTYLQSLERVRLEEYNRMNRSQKMAFLINAYNAFTIELILQNYPVDSIKDIGGWFSSPWKKEFFTLLGKKRTLDWIEHKMLRPKFKEPRIHYAVNCASVGCPRLRDEAYNDKMLELQLQEQEKVFLQDTSRNRIDKDKQELKVSKIFDWFDEDFENLRSYLANQLTQDKQLRSQILQQKWDIEYTDYSWKLNEHN